MAGTAAPIIGVFDSGFGGLTVLRELLPRIPGAEFVYLGDTARLPYGSKSQATIARYAVESARFLEDHGADHLVIACNTASALALPEITAAVSIPVTGVIGPAIQATQIQHPGAEVLILATAATVHSHAYRTQCEALGLHATEKACPLLVPLVEEGWIRDPHGDRPENHVTSEVLRIYLAEALAACTPAAVILGCTHYPLLAPEIERTLRLLGSDADVIDSPRATAITVAAALSQHVTLSQAATLTQGEPLSQGPAQARAPDQGSIHCFVTDSVEKFQHLGSRFLGRPIPNVHLVDLGG